MCKTTQKMYNRGCGQHTSLGRPPYRVLLGCNKLCASRTEWRARQRVDIPILKGEMGKKAGPKALRPTGGWSCPEALLCRAHCTFPGWNCRPGALLVWGRPARTHCPLPQASGTFILQL